MAILIKMKIKDIGFLPLSFYDYVSLGDLGMMPSANYVPYETLKDLIFKIFTLNKLTDVISIEFTSYRDLESLNEIAKTLFNDEKIR
jgi:hypothetical protein